MRGKFLVEEDQTNGRESVDSILTSIPLETEVEFSLDGIRHQAPKNSTLFRVFVERTGMLKRKTTYYLYPQLVGQNPEINYVSNNEDLKAKIDAETLELDFTGRTIIFYKR